MKMERREAHEWEENVKPLRRNIPDQSCDRPEDGKGDPSMSPQDKMALRPQRGQLHLFLCDVQSMGIR
jgi:hypothetical protein